jgi:shikimate dehydrogenase
MKSALIGWPIRHSISPAMHNAAFRALGLAGEYSLLPVEHEKDLGRVLEGMRADPEWIGANVTVPYKEKVIPHLDDLEGAAAELKAVNTIVRRGNRLVGCNTDLPAFLADVKRNGMDFSGKPAVVIGSGGAARAVVFGLVESGCSVTLVAVVIEQALALARELGRGRVTAFEWRNPTVAEKVRSAALIVNTSPVGMWPHSDASPWPEGMPFPESAGVYDLVYNPFETRFLRAARRLGLKAASGLGMLVEQGALAFELWTGAAAPREAMMRAAQAALEPREAP